MTSPQSTNRTVAVWIRRWTDCYKFRKQNLTKPFIQLFYTKLEDDTVMCTEHCDVALIIQTVDRLQKLAEASYLDHNESNLYILTGLQCIWHIYWLGMVLETQKRVRGFIKIR